jgi:hypothetical protein
MFTFRYIAPACSLQKEVALNCKLIDKQLSLITRRKQITYVVISLTYRAVGGLEHADRETGVTSYNASNSYTEYENCIRVEPLFLHIT